MEAKSSPKHLIKIDQARIKLKQSEIEATYQKFGQILQAPENLGLPWFQKCL